MIKTLLSAAVLIAGGLTLLAFASGTTSASAPLAAAKACACTCCVDCSCTTDCGSDCATTCSGCCSGCPATAKAVKVEGCGAGGSCPTSAN